MKKILSTIAIVFAAMWCVASCSHSADATAAETDTLPAFHPRGVISHGGMIQGDPAEKKISLVFTADSLFNGADTIISTLRLAGIKGSFFFTGYMFTDQPQIVERLKADGHYIGTHSFGHLLYAPWENRDSMLISKEEFTADLNHAAEVMSACGIDLKHDSPFFIPPYEWYNDTVSAWAEELGMRVINFTPGTGSNGDYTVPSMGKSYRPSSEIYQNLMKCEAERGLNGHFLLIHFGVWEERPDKFFLQLPQLIDELKQRGYKFVSVPEMMIPDNE